MSIKTTSRATASEKMAESESVIVVGAGLAGLTAAVELANEGRSVTVLESAAKVGGRAMTRDVQGFSFNLGPRALYVRGEGKAILDRLGVAYRGHRPPLVGSSALIRGGVGPLPMGLWSLMTCPWMSWRERFEVAGFLARLPKLDPTSLQGQTVDRWFGDQFRFETSRALLEGLLRLTTYCADHGHMCAMAASRQLQIGLSDSVLYIDAGWQTLADGLRQTAIDAGARVVTGARARRVEARAEHVVCELADGERLRASSVVLAVGPEQADRLLDSRYERLSRWVNESRPVHAACLDVALRELPRPQGLFAQGIDSPYYFSVHSASAKVAPEGKALVHVLRYLQAGENIGRDQLRQELEGVLDQMQPGWREHLVDQQLMPKMLVCHDMPSAGRDRAHHRLSSQIYVAGDWVGTDGLLADAAIASGYRAAQSILETRPVEREQRRVA